jgi:phosphoribosylaminoimidazole (AIR) synthetase
MAEDEAYRVFNMGIGMIVVIDSSDGERAQAALPDALVIGQLVERQAETAGVRLV